MTVVPESKEGDAAETQTPFWKAKDLPNILNSPPGVESPVRSSPIVQVTSAELMVAEFEHIFSELQA